MLVVFSRRFCLRAAILSAILAALPCALLTSQSNGAKRVDAGTEQIKQLSSTGSTPGVSLTVRPAFVPGDPCSDPVASCTTCVPSDITDCGVGGGPNTPAQPPDDGGGGGGPACPTGISYNPDGSTLLPIGTVFPTYKSGAGLVAQMQVTGPESDYDGVQIVEVLSNGTNTCTQYGITNTCGTASTFTVGNGNKSVDGSTQPATQNVFWDNHVFYSTTSALPQGASCQIVCMQRYTCGGSNIGQQFTITKTLTGTTYSGTAVTNVSASKE